MRMSFCPSLPLAMSRSRVPMRRRATFHSKPSCSLKNSRKAGSCDRRPRSLRGGEDGGSGPPASPSAPPPPLPVESPEPRRARPGLASDRQICASRPSTWRMPLRTLGPSNEERLSKASERRASMTAVRPNACARAPTARPVPPVLSTARPRDGLNQRKQDSPSRWHDRRLSARAREAETEGCQYSWPGKRCIRVYGDVEKIKKRKSPDLFCRAQRRPGARRARLARVREAEGQAGSTG